MSATDTSTMKPGTSGPFGALEQVDAGPLSVGYAEARLRREAPQAFAEAIIDADGY
jgi:hypothetical protein